MRHSVGSSPFESSPEQLDRRHPHVDDCVRLKTDIPELLLYRGAVGVVRSTWFAPSEAYEVEFQPEGLDCHTRALLQAEQIQVEDMPAARA